MASIEQSLYFLPLSVLFFLIIEQSVLMVLVFYEKCLLEKVMFNAMNSAIRRFFFVMQRMSTGSKVKKSRMNAE